MKDDIRLSKSVNLIKLKTQVLHIKNLFLNLTLLKAIYIETITIYSKKVLY